MADVTWLFITWENSGPAATVRDLAVESVFRLRTAAAGPVWNFRRFPAIR